MLIILLQFSIEWNRTRQSQSQASSIVKPESKIPRSQIAGITIASIQRRTPEWPKIPTTSVSKQKRPELAIRRIARGEGVKEV
jgi:hypothetical protein